MGLVVDEKPASISLPIAQDEYDCTLGLTRKHGEFAPKRVLIVSKTTRLQYELHRLKLDISHAHDPAFLHRLKIRGTNFLELKRKHELQTSYIDSIVRELKKDNIEVKVATRADYTKDLALWGDLIISAGGDGTFLTAASKVRNGIPVIGINSDPVGSEGHLCLTGKLRIPPDEVVRQFLSGDFYWTQRQRIRVTITKAGESDSPPPVSSRSGKRSRESKACNFFSDDESEESEPPVEPMLALNEVFIGESHAARVSYYEVQIDDGPLLKQKSSGMTVCTGTGSTSWHYNINRLNEQTVGEIIDIMGSMGFKSNDEINDKVVEEICNRFNQQLIFEPSAHKMAFSVRDPVFNATFPKTVPRGFAKKIKVKSRCSHAHLVLDGSTSIPFNQGTEVVLELIPQDALQTFDGIVFAEKKYNEKECRWEGNGSQFLLVVIPLENATTTAALGLPMDSGACGLFYDPENTEHVVSLVISPDPVILTEEAFALRVKCVHSSSDIVLTLSAPSMDPIKLANVESMTVFGTGSDSPQLGIQLIEGHGLFGKSTNQSTIGQRLTLDVHLKDTSIYDLFVQNCVASDGNSNPDASINIMDADGCAVGLPRAVDVPVFSSAPQKNATKHIYVYIYGFQFSSSDYVQFECTVIPCVYECLKKQCQAGTSVSLAPQKFGLQRGAQLPPIKIQTTLKIINRNDK